MVGLVLVESSFSYMAKASFVVLIVTCAIAPCVIIIQLEQAVVQANANVLQFLCNP